MKISEQASGSESTVQIPLFPLHTVLFPGGPLPLRDPLRRHGRAPSGRHRDGHGPQSGRRLTANPDSTPALHIVLTRDGV